MNRPSPTRRPPLSARWSIGQLSAMVALAAALVYVLFVASASPSHRVLFYVDWLAFHAFQFLTSWGFRCRNAGFVMVFVFGAVQWFAIAFAWTWMLMSLFRGRRG